MSVSAPTIVTPWRPAEVARALKDRRVEDVGYASCLKSTQPGDVAAVYETGPDGGIVALYHFTTSGIRHPDLRYAAWGHLVPLSTRLDRAVLLDDPLLARLFQVVRAPKSLPADVANRLKALIVLRNPALPKPPTDHDEPPEGWADHRWAPAGGAHLWGNEDSMQQALHEHEPSWRFFGFSEQPAREVRPPGSQDEVDLARSGLLIECKLRADSRTLEQLDRYFRLFRARGEDWHGWIVAGHSFSARLAALCSERDDVRLAACIRDRNDQPLLVEIDGPDDAWPEPGLEPAIELLEDMLDLADLIVMMAELAGLSERQIDEVLDDPEAHSLDATADQELSKEQQIKAVLADARLLLGDSVQSFRALFDDLGLNYHEELAALQGEEGDSADASRADSTDC